MAFNVPKHTRKASTYAVSGKASKPTPMPSSPQYLVQGRTYFDKKWGNTYHAVTVTDLKTGEVVYTSEKKEYGYGDQWKHTAYKELVKKGLAKEEDEYNHDLNRKRFIYVETEVNRQRDLI